jgi:Zn-finger nucleic acid-binding protein
MNCPRCETTLAEIDRDGITIDRCERCRGIWLDRGELEKLLARAPESARQGRARSDHDDDDDDDRREHRGSGRRRSLWDIFD